MSSKFSTRHAFFGTLDGVGFKELFNRGIKAQDLPEGDDELRSAYQDALDAYTEFEAAEEHLIATARNSKAATEVRSPYHGRAHTT